MSSKLERRYRRAKLWTAPRVIEPFSGQLLQIALLSRSQAQQLYRLLVPAG